MKDFFLSNKHKLLLEREDWSRKVGLHLTTKGEFTKQFAKLITAVWSELAMRSTEEGSIRYETERFKDVIGRFNPLFQGNEQQDSSEALNGMINFMSGDQYKWPAIVDKDGNVEVLEYKRPYITQTDTLVDKDGKQRIESEAAKEAW